MTETTQAKPTKFYIDFENVHGAGLKGVTELSERDEVIVIYSQAAETFHIEHAIDILNSKAHIQFVEVDGGTRNAADFQLIVALFGAMDESYDYAIISGDGGFDAAIKMGERMGLPPVKRFANVQGDIEPEKTEKPKSRRTRRRRDDRDSPRETEQQTDTSTGKAEQPENGNAKTASTSNGDVEMQLEPQVQADAESPTASQEAAVEGQPEEQKPSSSRRRPRRRRRSSGAQDEQAPAQSEAASDETVAQSEVANAKTAAQTESATDDAAKPEISILVKNLLDEKGVQISDEQLATVASAIDGPDGRQGFYRRIIKIERQQKGRILYRQVRDYYDALLEILQG